MRRFFVFTVLLIFVFSGCSDYNELNMQELVRNVGIDFKDDEILVCVACEGSEESRIIKKSTGNSFFEAVRTFSEKSDKKLYWGHLQAVVFGEDAITARFSETLDALSRARDVYPDIVPVAAVGVSAEEVVTEGEAVLGAFSNRKNSRRFSELPLWKLARGEELFGVSVIPAIMKKEEGLSLSGGAIISGNGVRGYLSGEEMLLIGLLTSDGGGGISPDDRGFGV